jgi:hypothetical protein
VSQALLPASAQRAPAKPDSDSAVVVGGATRQPKKMQRFVQKPGNHRIRKRRVDEHPDVARTVEPLVSKGLMHEENVSKGSRGWRRKGGGIGFRAACTSAVGLIEL